MPALKPSFPHAGGVPGTLPHPTIDDPSREAARQRVVERLLETAIEAQQVELLLELAQREHARHPTPESLALLERETRSALDHEKRFERLWQEAEAMGLVEPFGRGGSPARA